MYCKKCNTDKDETDFNWKIKNLLRQHQCRECQNAYVKAWYRVPENTKSSKARAVKNSQNHRIRNREFILEHLKNNPCVDCKIEDVRVLEFDHLRDKYKTISDMSRMSYSLSRIKKEMDKCEVVCANCHRIRTYSRTTTYKSNNANEL